MPPSSGPLGDRAGAVPGERQASPLGVLGRRGRGQRLPESRKGRRARGQGPQSGRGREAQPPLELGPNPPEPPRASSRTSPNRPEPSPNLPEPPARGRARPISWARVASHVVRMSKVTARSQWSSPSMCREASRRWRIPAPLTPTPSRFSSGRLSRACWTPGRTRPR